MCAQLKAKASKDYQDIDFADGTLRVIEPGTVCRWT